MSTDLANKSISQMFSLVFFNLDTGETCKHFKRSINMEAMLNENLNLT